MDQNELFSPTVAGAYTLISRVSSFGPVVMAMVLLEMSIILVYGMRFFFTNVRTPSLLMTLLALLATAIYGDIVVEYVLVGVVSDNMVLGVCFLPAYNVR